MPDFGPDTLEILRPVHDVAGTNCPGVRYAIVANLQGGEKHLARCLRLLGLGIPAEYLSERFAASRGIALDDRFDAAAFRRLVEDHRTTANGVFGIIVTAADIQRLGVVRTAALLRGMKVIRMTWSLVADALALSQARRSHRWDVPDWTVADWPPAGVGAEGDAAPVAVEDLRGLVLDAMQGRLVIQECLDAIDDAEVLDLEYLRLIREPQAALQDVAAFITPGEPVRLPVQLAALQASYLAALQPVLGSGLPQFLAPQLQAPAIGTAAAVPEPALVMMLKNEADIIYDNLAWHFEVGFRRMLLLENGSTDSSAAEIARFIARHEPRGCRVCVVQDREVGYYQARKTNAAAAYAAGFFAADWIFALDADEFLELGARPLRETLAQAVARAEDAFGVSHTAEQFALGVKFSWKSHFCTERDDMSEWHPTRRLTYRRQELENQKTACLWRSDFAFSQGNHHVRSHGRAVPTIDLTPEGVSLRHYSIRSFEHFERKVRAGGRAYRAATGLDPNWGGHWRRWYDLLEAEGRSGLEREFHARYVKRSIDLVYDPLA